jgi:hypothetical protein
MRRPVSRRAKRGHTCLPVLHWARVGSGGHSVEVAAPSPKEVGPRIARSIGGSSVRLAQGA